MLIVKVSETADGTIIAETARQQLARFTGQTRQDVINYLQHKARQCGEQLRIVESFDEPEGAERLTERDIRHMMKRNF
ncbi:MAG TPA: hypothetical protein DCZ72_15320 [Armatimonadetes bacterium]|nr:hypothetical protein [Armatimonadota bacterium]